MAVSIITTSANLGADSITIPLTTLNAFGLASGEYANTKVGIQRALFAVLKAIAAEPFTSVIGLSRPATIAQVSAGTNLVNSVFTLTETLVGNLTANPTTLTKIPLPTSGTNSGLGGLALGDIFSGVDIQSAGTSVSNQLVIPTEDLATWGSDISSPATDVGAGADNRVIIASLFKMFTQSIGDSSVVVRTSSVSSAIVARSISTPTLGTLPANATADTNPTTDLWATDRLIPIASTMSVTFQQVIDQSTDTLDINLVTA